MVIEERTNYMNELDLLANEVLSQLEIQETKLLTWGFVGGRFAVLEEVERVLLCPATSGMSEYWNRLKNQGVTADDIVQNFEDRKLIIKDNKTGLGRTRFAETIKRMSFLKQRFKPEDWYSGLNLVSNMKLALRYRQYPRRDKGWDGIATVIPNHLALGRKVVSRLLKEGSIKLSQFQVNSLDHILQGLSKGDAATIIGAGTGSGKTKAFYLPAFAIITENIQKDAFPYVKVLGIYPRTELLKDQMKEAASELLELQDLLQLEGVRQATIGAYYGDTPPNAGMVKDSKYNKWEQGKVGYICPYVICSCGSSLMEWSFDNLEREIECNQRGYFGQFEILCCPCCGNEISFVKLTRKSMNISPPDILFTTTEMINLKLADISEQHVFGVNKKRPPKLLLLDEVHIYNGLAGAQVAYVLRRWRHMVRSFAPEGWIHFVGLSATLTKPAEFFSKLTGVPERYTAYITPAEEDLISEGIEYNTVLRGDPISATALLSTTVQTAMLLGRMLDPMNADVSRGAWGKKIYGFSDKMDTVTRWYHIERDAEEYKCLSQYRDRKSIADSTLATQVKQGQAWTVSDWISPGCLKRPLTLDITSSRSRGVDPNAKLVIATSTLEVGFNDPEVGAVIQHKAPRDMASFLQRKGRAGRKRGMRPWMVVVTSAYGRDRWVFEHPEQLFNPLLPEMMLPMRNHYVLHIQAAYAFVDWLGTKLKEKGFKYANVWQILSPPKIGWYGDENKVICNILDNLLLGDIKELQQFLGKALQLDSYEINQVLWAPPRSILMDLVPWLYSGLVTEWAQGVQDNEVINTHPYSGKNPLSLHVPRNLFSSLQGSEVMISYPGGGDKPEYLGLGTALYEYAPGNVSKRFAEQYKIRSAHWMPLPQEGDPLELNGKHIKSQAVEIISQDSGDIYICTPNAYELAQIPSEVSDRSSGRLNWQTIIRPNGVESLEGGIYLVFANAKAINNVVQDVRLFSSDNQEGVLFTRYASNAIAEVKDKKGNSERRDISFTFNGHLAALGFSCYSDALFINIKYPDLRSMLQAPDWNSMRTEFAPQYYWYRLGQDSRLADLSVFEIEWLCQVVLAAIMATGISRAVSVSDAILLFSKNIPGYTERTLKVIFQVAENPDATSDEDHGRLFQNMKAHLSDPLVCQAIIENADVLHKDLALDDQFWNWLGKRYPVSVAAAFQTAVEHLIPDVSVDGLLVDIDERGIWISESEAGGMGIISRVATEIQNRPKEFDEYFMRAARTCLRNGLAQGLTATLARIKSGEMSMVFGKLRSADTLDSQQVALTELQKVLYRTGIAPKRDLIVSIMYKLVNQNSDCDVDSLIILLHERWQWEIERLACRIHPRVFAIAALKIDEVKDKLDLILTRICYEEIEDKHRFNLIESLLWDECMDYCPDCLQLGNPYGEFLPPSRLCLSNLLTNCDVMLNYGIVDWKKILREQLCQYGRVRIVTNFSDLASCRQDLIIELQEPVEIGFELLYPFICGVTNLGDQWVFDVEIREVLHA